MEELISKMSAEITKSEAKIWKPKIDLDYKQGQAKQSKEAATPCVFSIIRDDYTGHCRFKKGLCVLSDIPTVIREHIDKVLEFKKLFLLDDIICVTNGTIEDNEREVREVLSKLQNAEYHASGNIELFKRELTWLSYYINLDGVKPIKDKTDTITKLEAPKNAKESKSFLGSIHHLFKLTNKHSKKTDRKKKY